MSRAMRVLALLGSVVVATAGCTTTEKRISGAAVGGVGGAVAGSAIAGSGGALVGGIGGAVAGAVIAPKL